MLRLIGIKSSGESSRLHDPLGNLTVQVPHGARCGPIGQVRKDPAMKLYRENEWKACPYCHRSLVREVRGRPGDDPTRRAGLWAHAGAGLPWGGPDRAAALVQHHDAGRPIADLGATPDLLPDEYAARIEYFRGRPDVRAVLARVAPQCLPPLSE